ncbi:MAG: YitT family protein [Clostridia bacterium]|nr:YitT family protein [Clostridia bacterium]
MTAKKKFHIHEKIKQNLIILLGIMMTGMAVSVFLVPNKVVSGGVSGISTILYHTLHIPVGLSFAVINLVLLVIAFKFIGKSFVIKSIVGAALLSLFVQLFSYMPPLTRNPFLATVFGAFFYGLGIGLALVEGASTGGTDILGRLFQHFFPQMKIGKLLFVIDSIVIVSSFLVFKNIDLLLFGLIALFLSTYAVDWLIHKLNISKLAFIVSECGEKIAECLVHTSHRGVTLIDATGAYTMDDKKVLVCALKESEVVDFQRKILEIDESAFIIFSESQQIVGNGFHVYK